MVKNINAKVTFEIIMGKALTASLVSLNWNNLECQLYREQDLYQPRDVPAGINENLPVFLKGDPGTKNNCT